MQVDWVGPVLEEAKREALKRDLRKADEVREFCEWLSDLLVTEHECIMSVWDEIIELNEVE